MSVYLLAWGNTPINTGDKMTEMTNEQAKMLLARAVEQIEELKNSDDKEQVEIGEALELVTTSVKNPVTAVSMLKAGGLKLSLRGGLDADLQTEVNRVSEALALIEPIIDQINSDLLQTRATKEKDSVNHTGKTFVTMIVGQVTRNARTKQKARKEANK